MNRGATFSGDRLYRYDLTRSVQSTCTCERCADFFPKRNGFVLFVLCNPSKASENDDDPTERRAWGFTSSLGYGCMRFVNVNPFCSTDPSAALAPSTEALRFNDHFIESHANHAALIVCAWGQSANVSLTYRAISVLRATQRKLHTFGFNRDGSPKHPLYLSKNSQLIDWNL